MKPSRILLAVCTAVLLLASSASASVPAPTPLPAPLLTPDKVDSKNYDNPSPDDFQTVIVHTTLDGVPTMRLSFGKGLFSDLGGVLANYYLRYDPSTDSFVYEER